MCGGTARTAKKIYCFIGLSPRVRGNPARQLWHRVCIRSIPACAGEPRTSGRAAAGDTVYPRVCGGTPDVRPSCCRRYGLSPRVRGNQVSSGTVTTWTRSIPACAGEPPSWCDSTISHTVYPRVCGGTSDGYVRVINNEGLSPRVRGNHEMLGITTRYDRSIPACAGEPLLSLLDFLPPAGHPTPGHAHTNPIETICPARHPIKNPRSAKGTCGKISPAGLILKIRFSVARPDDLDRPKARTLKSSLRSKPELSSGVQLQNESPGRAERQRQRRDDTRPVKTRPEAGGASRIKPAYSWAAKPGKHRP